jgi:hypothetical protein
MQSAETVLGVLRERGRRGLPCDELYRQLFNPQLHLLAYGRLYSNKGAMTPGVTPDTVDGMSVDRPSVSRSDEAETRSETLTRGRLRRSFAGEFEQSGGA